MSSQQTQRIEDRLTETAVDFFLLLSCTWN